MPCDESVLGKQKKYYSSWTSQGQLQVRVNALQVFGFGSKFSIWLREQWSCKIQVCLIQFFHNKVVAHGCGNRCTTAGIEARLQAVQLDLVATMLQTMPSTIKGISASLEGVISGILTCATHPPCLRLSASHVLSLLPATGISTLTSWSLL